MDNKEFIKDLLTRKLDEVIGGPKPVGDKLDSYYAYQAAKEKAKKDGKVWDKMGQDEKDRYVAPEMEKAGYEKKDGNMKWTRKPTEDEKKFADKVRADDEHEYWLDKARDLENKIEDLKDEIGSKKEETMKTFKSFVK